MEVEDIEHHKPPVDTIRYYSKEAPKRTNFKLFNVTNTGFRFHLLLISNDEIEGEDTPSYPYGEIADSATYIDTTHAVFSDGNCKIDFYFNGDTVKIVENGNCEKYRNKKITFNSVFYKNK